MKGEKLEKVIEENLENIANLISFNMTTSKQEVKEKIKNLNFYVFDDYYQQRLRIEKIDLMNIANSFALDVLDTVKNLDESKKKKLQKAISKFIYESKIKDYVNKDFCKFLDNHKELNNKESLKALLKYTKCYLNDYEVSEIYSLLSSSKTDREYIANRKIRIKRDLIKKYLKIDINVPVTISSSWSRIMDFSSICDQISLESKDFKNKNDEARKDFYKSLGLKGETLEELTKSAREKGLEITSDLADKLSGLYNKELYESIKNIFNADTNYSHIKEDLDKKGIKFNIEQQVLYLLDINLNVAANFDAVDKDYNPCNIIIFENGLDAYDSEFTETCIHEIIHYIGGKNEDYDKKGLYYNSQNKYLNLEEAYTNCLAKQFAKEYRKEYGDIIENCKKYTSASIYDCTLEYTKKLFETYFEKLNKIHLSNDISLEKANEILPLDQIADSISRIMKADSKNYKEYTKQELEKLDELIRNDKNLKTINRR